MVIAAVSSVTPLLVCPRCHGSLLGDDAAPAGFHCTTASCRYAAPGSFPVLDRWPVVVDVERSLLDAATVEGWLAAEDTHEVRRGLREPLVERLPASVRGIWKPLNRVAERNIARLLALLPRRPARVLVVGGGTVGNGLAALYASGGDVEVIGFDLYGSDVTQLIADAHDIPFATGSVDAVVVQAVLEHVLDPRRVVDEIHRVLAEDGLVYAETPFMQQVHAGAYDFTRFTASGHRHLFRAFEEIDSGTTAGPGTAALWALDHLVRGVTRSRTLGRVARTLFFWLRLLDGVADPAHALDGASAVFFLGRRSGETLTGAQVVADYRGAQR